MELERLLSSLKPPMGVADMVCGISPSIFPAVMFAVCSSAVRAKETMNAIEVCAEYGFSETFVAAFNQPRDVAVQASSSAHNGQKETFRPMWLALPGQDSSHNASGHVASLCFEDTLRKTLNDCSWQPCTQLALWHEGVRREYHKEKEKQKGRA